MEFYQLTLKVQGILKNQRKAKTHSFNIGQMQYNQDPREATDFANKLLATDFKTVTMATLTLSSSSSTKTINLK